MSEPRRLAAEDIPAAELVDRLTVLTGDIIKLIDHETELLAACEPLKITDLQADKARLSNEYSMDIKAIGLKPELIDRAPAEKISRMKTLMKKLEERVAVNAEALLAAKSVSESIVKNVAAAVSPQAKAGAAYGRDGAAVRPAVSRIAAMALDQRI